jgi:hypothetical protein
MGNQASQLSDEPGFAGAGKDLAHFDHYFKGCLHSTKGVFFTKTFGEAINDDRNITLTCKGEGFSIAEDIGIQATKLLEVSYLWVTGVSWDHASSQVKLTITTNDNESFVILTMANSIELEGELKLRFGSVHAANQSFRIPYPMYVGMFAGTTKPKPFQRKRPNLSRLPPGKLPQLQDMRNMAVQLHRGVMKPCAAGESRRVQIAMQHIHEGANTFILLNCRGLPNGISPMSNTAVLVLADDALIYKSQRMSSGNQELYIPYETITSWTANDIATVTDAEGLSVEADLDMGPVKITFGVRYIRDVQHTMEFFWNKWRVNNGLSVKLGSTHGRPIETVSTLSGEMSPPERPVGSTDVVDQDGIVIRPGARIVNRRRSVLENVMASKDTPDVVPPENREVRKFWHNVVLHQGWLLKKGGIGLGDSKSWIKRYFVLYNTSMGHYLIYYSDFTECPLYTTDRTPRNVVDLAKTTFIRPGSNKAEFSDTPPHSFDIVTTEREWTLCAESQENVQKWLKLITRCVDEDVAILPDEELIFKVKPKVDPLSVLNPNDYSTTLKVCANGIAVTSPNAMSGGKDHENYFWAYTDFYKWSLLSQSGKLALLINVFADSTFTRRHEYIFRNKEAVRLATAIEFFIEKFMTVMHISLELTATEKDYNASSAPVESNMADASEWQDDEINEEPVDLLDMDDSASTPTPTPQASKPAAPATVFGDDPFGSDPFDSAPVSAVEEKIAPPLTAQQIEQHRLWLHRAMSNNGGPLYDDGMLQIASKIEVKFSQARVTFYCRNNGPGKISGLELKVLDPAGLLRFELSNVTPNLDALAQATGILMLECMKPASPGPTLEVKYKDSNNGLKDNTVSLPLFATTFNDPLALNNADFNMKWEQLSTAGQHKQEVFRPKAPIAPAVVLAGMTKALKFGKVTNMPDESEYVIYGASSLKTGATGPNGDKISVGCLVKIEMNVQSNAIRLTARTLHPAATSAIFECARSLLG